MINHPNNWKIVKKLDNDEIRNIPDQTSKDSISIIGYSSESYHLYSVPLSTDIAEIVSYFKVADNILGADTDKFLEKLKILYQICPYKVVFADPRGLKLLFCGKLDTSSIKKIEELYEDIMPITFGLEIYLSEWEGEGSIFSPVLKSKIFHFWWD